MRWLFLVSTVTLGVSFTGPASATQTYFGSGLGKQCYDAVSLGQASRTDLKLCTKALQSGTLTGGNRPATYVNRGIILMRMEQYNDAIEDYERALELDPALPEAKINMGAALIGLRRYASAISFLQDGLKENPLSPHVAYYNLGIAHELLGDYINARRYYSSALDVAPDWNPALRKLELMPQRNDKQSASVGDESSR